MRDYVYKESGLRLVFCVSDEGRVALTYFGPDSGAPENSENPFSEKEEGQGPGRSPVEIALSGSGFNGHHGMKRTDGVASAVLRFSRISDFRDDEGRRIELETESEDLLVRTVYLFVGSLPVVRTYNVVTAKKRVTLEYVSSLQIPELFSACEKSRYEEIRVMVPHNSWHGEAQWREYSLSDLGLTGCHDCTTLKRIYRFNTGSWSCKESLPTGFVFDENCVFNWQLEANGSWYAELGGGKNRVYLSLSGPTFAESGWQLTLNPGESFETVKAAVSFAHGLEGCVAAMTQYRRRNFAVYPADRDLPAQYNGYMHANWEHPKTERLLAQIDVTASLGLPYYVLDAGWFCKGEGNFWPFLGDWLHPEEPFTMPLKEIFDYARAKGLKCGLWIEIEDVGASCPCFSELEPMLMRRNGVLVCDNQRCFLDFSLQKTREYMTGVMDFLIERYGVEYFKIDYNVDCPVGGNGNSESCGQGLLLHNRAYLAWVEEIRKRYPGLILEGCASGGLRLDYATLYAYALGNISDQIHYDRVPYIVSNAAAYLVPEHTGVWSYPRAGASPEEIRMNFVNTAFFRLQYSGPCDQMSEEQLDAVREGIAFYESLREFKRKATAFFPLGMCRFFDETVAFGYRAEGRAYLAVYNLGGEPKKDIPCPFRVREAKIAYPVSGGASCSVSDSGVTVRLTAEKDACILELSVE